MKKIVTILILFCLAAVVGKAQKTRVICGDERTDAYLPKLKDKRVALFANHTAVVQGKHILDLLIDNKVNVVGIFAPEHGFRGTADAGEHVKNSTDKKTGVRIFSLYNGKNGTPNIDVLKNTDVLVVDIQDVGLRFYTYYISMLQLMNACAKTKTTMMILDRPNPNGCYVDGPVLDMKYKSGVGALPIPVVHGLTLAEMAGMINGEGWLEGGEPCQLDIIACRNYTHSTRYKLPIAPSPTSPTLHASPGAVAKQVRQVAAVEGNVLEKTQTLMILMTALSLVAAVLAVASLTTASLVERTGEFALLKAMGASSASVNRLILAETAVLGLVGTAVGALVGSGLAQLIGRIVFGSSITMRPMVYVLVVALISLVLLVATASSMRSILRIQPATALHRR